MCVWIFTDNQKEEHMDIQDMLYTFQDNLSDAVQTLRHLESLYTRPYIACCLVSAHLVVYQNDL